MEGIRAFLRGEPVVVTSLLVAVATAVAAFGFELSAEQVAGLVLVAEAVSAFFARRSVTPV